MSGWGESLYRITWEGVETPDDETVGDWWEREQVVTGPRYSGQAVPEAIIEHARARAREYVYGGVGAGNARRMTWQVEHYRPASFGVIDAEPCAMGTLLVTGYHGSGPWASWADRPDEVAA
jgi:GNAT superfamily N-acetyltransferase